MKYFCLQAEKFHFRLFIVQWTRDDTFHINPSWLLMLFHPWFKAFRGAISASFNVLVSTARQNKQTKKNPTEKLADETNVNALRLRCYYSAKDRKPDVEMQFGGNLCHRVVTCEHFPTQAPEFSFCLSEGPLTVRGVSASSVWGRNPASSWNTNNNPSMFFIRLLFLLTSAVSRPETITVTFSVFFVVVCVCVCVFSELQYPTQAWKTHTNTLLLPGLVCS